MAAEFVVFPTLLYVTQQGGSDNPCTLMKMSQETATSTPVCKMVIQRCLRQSKRSDGWNCRPLNPLTRGRTGDEMKTLSPTAQYLSHYEQNTSGHKKSPQKPSPSLPVLLFRMFHYLAKHMTRRLTCLCGQTYQPIHPVKVYLPKS